MLVQGPLSSSVHTVKLSGTHDDTKPLMRAEHISQNNLITLSLKINSAFLAHSHKHWNAETLGVSSSCKTLAFKPTLDTRLTWGMFQKSFSLSALIHQNPFSSDYHIYTSKLYFLSKAVTFKACIFSGKCQGCYTWVSFCPRGQQSLNNEANKTANQ